MLGSQDRDPEGVAVGAVDAAGHLDDVLPAERAARDVQHGGAGLQLEQGMAATSYIATEATSATRAADRLTLDWRRKGVPDGAMLVRYGFDDGSSQLVETVVAGGVAVVPTDLARPWLRNAARA